MAEESFLGALKKNWFLMIPSVILIALGFVLGNWSQWSYDRSRSEGKTDVMQLPASSPAARAANENFVKQPIGTGRNKRMGRRFERKYLAQLEEMKPSDEDYPLTIFRLGNVYYSTLRDYEKAAPYFQEIVDNHPEYGRMREVLTYLADCFAKNGERSKEIALYEDLMSEYPPDSELYTWAEEQLASMPNLREVTVTNEEQ